MTNHDPSLEDMIRRVMREELERMFPKQAPRKPIPNGIRLDRTIPDNRTVNALAKAGIGTVEQVLKMTQKELIGLHGMGRRTFRELQYGLLSSGYTLPEEWEKPDTDCWAYRDHIAAKPGLQ